MNLDYFNDKERESQKKFASTRDKIFNPLVKLLNILGISANFLTLLGVLVLIGGVLISLKYPIAYVPSLILYVLLDGIDGPLARYQGTSSDVGALNDITADQVGVPIVLGYLAYGHFIDGWVAATLTGFYIITIYNMVFCNLQEKRVAFTLRLKYIFFAVGAGCALKISLITQYANLFMEATSLYYAVMIAINQWVAGRRKT